MRHFYFLFTVAGFALCLITTTAVKAQNVTTTDYCPATAEHGDYFNITNVTLNTLNNSSSGIDGYEDFTAKSTNLLSGSPSNAMSVTNSAVSTIPRRLNVFIDFNHNFSFDDPGEKIYDGSTNYVATTNFNFAVPANGIYGPTRMRVRIDYENFYGNNTSCGDSYYGQVEDYTVNLVSSSCQTTTSDTTATACKGFVWHGMNYSTSGNYKDTLLNAGGCDSVVTLHLTIQQQAVTNNISVVNAVCYGSATGSITMTPTTGTSPYSYSIGTSGNYIPGGSSYTFGNLKAGTYRTYVKDNGGCLGVAGGIVVAQNAKVTATATSTPLSCSNSTNGSITIDNPVGIAPLQYKLGSGGILNYFTAPYTITGLVAGNYRIYVVDADGCSSAGIAVSVSQPPAPPVNFSVVQPTCGTPTGTISLSTPDTAGATYKINPGSSIYKTQSVYPNLVPGTYYGYVKNADGCAGRSVAIVLSPATGCRTTFARGEKAISEAGATTLGVSISSNPSSNVFRLTAYTAKTEAIQLRVIDINGKVVYTAKGSSTQTFTFGEAFNSGVYLVEVWQGKTVETVKAVKNR